MNLFDRFKSRKHVSHPDRALLRADAAAVDDYERMLRTAPPATLERIHAEAFERLTPAQLDVLFERFVSRAESAAERPRDARPRSLAKAAARAESRRPGAIGRLLSPDETGSAEHKASVDDARGWVGYSLLDTIALYAVSSAVWEAWEVDAPGGIIWGDVDDWF